VAPLKIKQLHSIVTAFFVYNSLLFIKSHLSSEFFVSVYTILYDWNLVFSVTYDFKYFLK